MRAILQQGAGVLYAWTHPPPLNLHRVTGMPNGCGRPEIILSLIKYSVQV